MTTSIPHFLQSLTTRSSGPKLALALGAGGSPTLFNDAKHTGVALSASSRGMKRHRSASSKGGRMRR